MFKKDYTPRSALLELTLRCNMNCSHCGSTAGCRRENELSTEQWLDICDQLSNMGCKLVTLLGGEPLLRKDWYIIAQRIKMLGMRLTIISNGYLINNEIIEQFKILSPYTVGISLDGASADTHDKIRRKNGSFTRAVEVLQKLKEADVLTTVITTVSKTNIKDLPTIREMLVNKGIAWQIQIAVPIGRFTKEQLLSEEEFYAVALFISTSRIKYNFKELPIVGAHSMGYFSKKLPNIILGKWEGCPAGKTVLSVRSDGGVVGCLSLPDEFIEGNVKENKLNDIWNNDRKFRYNRDFQKENLKDNCKTCNKGRICKGGCLSVSTSITGKTNAGPLCLRKIENFIK